MEHEAFAPMSSTLPEDDSFAGVDYTPPNPPEFPEYLTVGVQQSGLSPFEFLDSEDVHGTQFASADIMGLNQSGPIPMGFIDAPTPSTMLIGSSTGHRQSSMYDGRCTTSSPFPTTPLLQSFDAYGQYSGPHDVLGLGPSSRTALQRLGFVNTQAKSLPGLDALDRHEPYHVLPSAAELARLHAHAPEIARGYQGPPTLGYFPIASAGPTQVASSSTSGLRTTHPQHAISERIAWPLQECLNPLELDNEQEIVPLLSAEVDKGLFTDGDDAMWKSYRRNYMQVEVKYAFHPSVFSGQLWLRRGTTRAPVQALGVNLAAAVNEPQGKAVELVLHTPKRDRGPKFQAEIVKVMPHVENSVQQDNVYGISGYSSAISDTRGMRGPTGPHLAYQHEGPIPKALQALYSQQQPDDVPYGSKTSHVFERVQFKQATANNGKRSTSQQYFVLIFELYADVREEGDAEPAWVKLAWMASERIQVRGRSPSHYQNEGQQVMPRSGTRATGIHGAGNRRAFAGPHLGAIKEEPNANQGGGVSRGNLHFPLHHDDLDGKRAMFESAGGFHSMLHFGQSNQMFSQASRYFDDYKYFDAERSDARRAEDLKADEEAESGYLLHLPKPEVSDSQYSTESQLAAATKYEDVDPAVHDQVW